MITIWLPIIPSIPQSFNPSILSRGASLPQQAAQPVDQPDKQGVALQRLTGQLLLLDDLLLAQRLDL